MTHFLYHLNSLNTSFFWYGGFCYIPGPYKAPSFLAKTLIKLAGMNTKQTLLIENAHWSHFGAFFLKKKDKKQFRCDQTALMLNTSAGATVCYMHFVLLTNKGLHVNKNVKTGVEIKTQASKTSSFPHHSLVAIFLESHICSKWLFLQFILFQFFYVIMIFFLSWAVIVYIWFFSLLHHHRPTLRRDVSAVSLPSTYWHACFSQLAENVTHILCLV